MTHHCSCSAGVAISDDGLQWHRGSGEVDGSQGPAQLRDVGRVLAPNTDWWWHDTRHVSVSDVQVELCCSSLLLHHMTACLPSEVLHAQLLAYSKGLQNLE